MEGELNELGGQDTHPTIVLTKRMGKFYESIGFKKIELDIYDLCNLAEITIVKSTLLPPAFSSRYYSDDRENLEHDFAGDSIRDFP